MGFIKQAKNNGWLNRRKPLKNGGFPKTSCICGDLVRNNLSDNSLANTQHLDGHSVAFIDFELTPYNMQGSVFLEQKRR